MRKIIGILICTLLIAATILPVAGTVNVGKNQVLEETFVSDNGSTFSSSNKCAFSVAQNKPVRKENIVDGAKQTGGSISVEITKPRQGYLYLNDREIIPLFFTTLIISPITVEVEIPDGLVAIAEFYIDDVLKHTDYTNPYSWECDEILSFKHTLQVKAYDYEERVGEVELPVWMFNTRSLSDPPPHTWILSPSGDGLLFDPLWETAIVYEETVTIKAVESNLSEDIVSTLFEYSIDGSNWITIGLDTYAGFEGYIFPDGKNRKMGDEGWSSIWDLSGLPEGAYYIRATMTDESGQTGAEIKKVYYDPVPPTPEIYEPPYGETVNGLATFRVRTDADDVVSTSLYLVNGLDYCFQGKNNGDWYEQENLGEVKSSDVGPDPTKGGANQHCGPAAAANALVGQGDSRIWPDFPASDIDLARELARKMNTNRNTGTNAGRNTNGPNNEIEIDSYGDALRDYLRQRGIGCDTYAGYYVTGYGIRMQRDPVDNHLYPVQSRRGRRVTWEMYNDELRSDESVILLLNVWDPGPDDDYGDNNDIIYPDGHFVTGKGARTSPNIDGSHQGKVLQPEDCSDSDIKWSEEGEFSQVEYVGNIWIVSGMWAISPKWEEWELVDADLNGEDGWCCMWDTTMVNDGVYTLLVETMDVNGFVGRASIVVEVDNYLDNTPPTTTIIFDGPYDWDPERDGWIISPDTYIGFSADDGDGVGVNATYLRHWHNGIWSPDWMIIEEDFNFTLPCLGLHYLEFYSVDYVGNTEEVNNVTIYVEEENHPPNTPTQPSGPTSGSVGESLHYESYFNDPDGDSMNIRWDWGDGTPTDWYGVITSGTTVGAYHSWDELGTYQVRTKARDIPHHAESGWSPPLTVTIN